jgi:hypothetical protein
MTERFTPEDRAYIDSDDAPDLPAAAGAASYIVQLTSPCLIPGMDGFVPGATPGCFILRHGDEHRVVAGATGFVCSPVGFSTTYAEYEPPMGAARGQFVAVYDRLPSDADWREGPNGRRAVLRDNGNKIEETINAFLLVENHPILFRFRSTAVKIGREFAGRAPRLRADGDGREVTGLAIGLWRITSKLEQRGDYRWFGPAVRLLGRLGDPEGLGPTIEQWRLASRARAAFRNGLGWGPSALPAPKAPATPTEPRTSRRRRGSTTFESGVQSAPPPAGAIGDDEIPF